MLAFLSTDVHVATYQVAHYNLNLILIDLGSSPTLRDRRVDLVYWGQTGTSILGTDWHEQFGAYAARCQERDIVVFNTALRQARGMLKGACVSAHADTRLDDDNLGRTDSVCALTDTLLSHRPPRGILSELLVLQGKEVEHEAVASRRSARSIAKRKHRLGAETQWQRTCTRRQ
eukprot:1689001-Rhodomonas_salina.1